MGTFSRHSVYSYSKTYSNCKNSLCEFIFSTEDRIADAVILKTSDYEIYRHLPK